MAEATTAAKQVPRRRVQRGEPYVWLSGGAMITGVLMIAALLAAIVWEGARTFWPRDIEVMVLGESRYLISMTDGSKVMLDVRDNLLLQGADGVLRDKQGKEVAEPRGPRRAGILDYRLKPELFAGTNLVLVDGKEAPLVDAQGKPVSPQAFIARPQDFPSPYRVPAPDGTWQPLEKVLGDDSVRDTVALMGSVRADRALDLADLPARDDGSLWRATDIDTPPTELLLRQGNRVEALGNNNPYAWIKSDVPDPDSYRRGNPSGYRAYLRNRGSAPAAACEIERLELGVLCCFVVELRDGDKVLANAEKDGVDKVWELFLQRHEEVRERFLQRQEIEKESIGDVNFRMTELERQLSRARYDHRDSAAMVAALDKLAKAFSGWSADEPLQKPDSDAEEQRKLAAAWLAGFGDVVKAWSESVAGFGLSQDESEVLDEVVAAQRERAALQAGEYYELRLQVTRLLAEEKQLVYRMRTLDGREAELPLAQVVRASRNNELGTGGRAGVYFSKLGEFLFEEPREANTEGGIFPVIIGTLIMTVLMSLAVVPFGVIAALYLREYAKQGPLVSAVRIAVNNLAGVPSIVFGIFGLGFLCTLVGGQVDHWLFPELLPSPTFGGGGILWASLTLALLTVPVVIVATEESLISVPASQREASLATGASRWQTIQRVILPQALPGILTGAILAMARGAGEVAPLMLVGAVKNAPALPVDGSSPYVHMERKFMHLGFHIYDIGFQSPDVDGTKPLVFTTTLVLLALIGVLNITAIRMRNKLRKRLKTSHV